MCLLGDDDGDDLELEGGDTLSRLLYDYPPPTPIFKEPRRNVDRLFVIHRPTSPNNRITTALPHFPSNFLFLSFLLHKNIREENH